MGTRTMLSLPANLIIVRHAYQKIWQINNFNCFVAEWKRTEKERNEWQRTKERKKMKTGRERKKERNEWQWRKERKKRTKTDRERRKRMTTDKRKNEIGGGQKRMTTDRERRKIMTTDKRKNEIEEESDRCKS